MFRPLQGHHQGDIYTEAYKYGEFCQRCAFVQVKHKGSFIFSAFAITAADGTPRELQTLAPDIVWTVYHLAIYK